jgi:hypothetical protein
VSDYIPNPPDPNRDPQNYDRYYEPAGSRGLTLVVGILVAIALVAGLMFFTGPPRDRNEQAQLPDRTTTTPAPDATRSPALPPMAPAKPANPAPGNPQQ